MTNSEKFWTALNILRTNTQCTLHGEILNEDDFNNNVKWNTGIDENGDAITTSSCPHSEITWTALKAEMDKL